MTMDNEAFASVNPEQPVNLPDPLPQLPPPGPKLPDDATGWLPDAGGWRGTGLHVTDDMQGAIFTVCSRVL